jgi:hypothetical protein
MIDGNLAKKAAKYEAGSMAILFLFIKPVFACQGIICDNGIHTDLCTVEENLKAAQCIRVTP